MLVKVVCGLNFSDPTTGNFPQLESVDCSSNFLGENCSEQEIILNRNVNLKIKLCRTEETEDRLGGKELIRCWLREERTEWRDGGIESPSRPTKYHPSNGRVHENHQ